MLPLLILVGFVMMTIGVAMLILGEVPFVAGKRIPALRARLIGLILVSFLPLAWGARLAALAVFEADDVQGPVVSWVLFGVCWLAIFVILFRVMAPKRAKRSGPTTTRAAANKNPFGESGPEDTVNDIGRIEEATEVAAAPKPAKKPPAKKSGKPQDKDPFDFS